MSVLWWVLKKVLRGVLDLTVILIVFALLPGIPPHAPFTTYEELKPPLPLEGALARNSILNDAERILDGKIVGPESIASRKPDEIFVSLHGGKILSIYGPRFDHFKVVASIGPGCDAPWEEEKCGRPLGLRFAPDGRLIVVDAYLGLFAVDVETGEKELLFDIQQEIEGAVPKIPDDVDVDDEGYIYWSDASSHASLNKGMIELFTSPSGRLIRFDPKTKTNTVLVKNLHFANGVQLSPDQQSVLVCETFKSRVHRHWLRGPRAGQTEIFVEQLPGFPDNLRSNGHGGYYVSLVSIFAEGDASRNALIGKFPVLRKLGLRLMYVTQAFLEAAGKLDSSRFVEKIASRILHLEPIGKLNLGKSNLTIVVEVDGDGSIIGSLQGDSGKVVLISETQRVGDYMFFGSPYNKYLGKLLVGSPPEMEVEGQGVRMKTHEEMVEKEEEEEKEKEEEEKEKEKEEVVEESSMDGDLEKEEVKEVVEDLADSEEVQKTMTEKEEVQKEVIDKKKVIEKEDVKEKDPQLKESVVVSSEPEITEEESEKVRSPKQEPEIEEEKVEIEKVENVEIKKEEKVEIKEEKVEIKKEVEKEDISEGESQRDEL